MELKYGLILILLLSLSIWYLVFFAYRQYLIDETRQELFKVRDELFLEAEKGSFSFDDRFYGMTRTTINGAIRFTHKMSAWRLIFSIIVAHVKGEPPRMIKYKKDWDDALSQVESEEAKKVLLRANTMMRTALLIHIMRSSIFLRGVIFLAGIILKAIHHKDLYQTTQMPKVKNELSILDAEANMIGQNV